MAMASDCSVNESTQTVTWKLEQKDILVLKKGKWVGSQSFHLCDGRFYLALSDGNPFFLLLRIDKPGEYVYRAAVKLASGKTVDIDPSSIGESSRYFAMSRSDSDELMSAPYFEISLKVLTPKLVQLEAEKSTSDAKAAEPQWQKESVDARAAELEKEQESAHAKAVQLVKDKESVDARAAQLEKDKEASDTRAASAEERVVALQNQKKNLEGQITSLKAAELQRQESVDARAAELEKEKESAHAKAIKLVKDKESVAMKTRGVISPLGEIIAHDVSFDPIVNIFDRHSEHEIRRYIKVECPGVSLEDVEIAELPNGVKIIIEKQKAIDEMAVHPVLPIRQHHGVWEREFLFEASDGRFEVCDPGEFSLEDGVLTVVLKRALQVRKWRLGARIGGGSAMAAKTAPQTFAPPSRMAAGAHGGKAECYCIASEPSLVMVDGASGRADSEMS